MTTLFKTVTGLRPANDFGAREDVEISETTSQIFLREIEVQAHIGVNPEEQNITQRLLISLEIDVTANPAWRDDNIDDVLSYNDLVRIVARIAESGHINLLETFAEKIIAECLSHPLIQKMTVSVEKPDIFKNARTVGIRITRSK